MAEVQYIENMEECKYQYAEHWKRHKSVEDLNIWDIQ